VVATGTIAAAAGSPWLPAGRRVPDTLHAYEAGKSDPALSTVAQLVRALEDAGVEIIDAGSVSQGRGVG
jgi:hypothetical protein